MMIIKTSNLVGSLAETVDLVSSTVSKHHSRVACIASYLGEACRLPVKNFEKLILASALHDVGGLTAKDRLNLLKFEENSAIHSEFGYLLLSEFQPFSHVAPIIRYHHAFWNNDREHGAGNEDIPLESRIVFLADRISVLMPQDFSFSHIDEIRRRIEDNRGSLFMPEAVDAFLWLSVKESFWLDAWNAVSQPLFDTVLSKNLYLDSENLLSLGKLFSQIIDFRSSFTATHSAGVSIVAESLAGFCGFSADEQTMMRLAGYLHDIGKLFVPEEILEKPARLTEEEYNKMRCHTYYTNRLLMNIKEFDTIRMWAAMHHERMDGNGYPFHWKAENLPIGSRIIAVADVFVAVTEDRPYRKGMSREDALNILLNMAESGALDPAIVHLLIANIDDIDGRRQKEQENARQQYVMFYRKNGFCNEHGL